MMESDECLVRHRQEVFCDAMTSHFLYKVRRYRKLLQKDGVSMAIESSDPTLTHRTMSVEEELQLVVGHHRPLSAASLRRNFQKAGKRLSAVSLFRWLYRIVQRNKAATILQHLDRVPEEEMLGTIEGVAREVSVAYEYQLVMLYGEREVIQLGQHAVGCLMVYLNNRDASFATEELLHAILEIKLQSSRHKDFVRTRTTIYQGRELCLRWRLGQILKQPGLRVASGDIAGDENNAATLFNTVKSESDALERTTKTGELSTALERTIKTVIVPETQNGEAASSGDGKIIIDSGDSEEHCIHIEETSKIRYIKNKTCVDDTNIAAPNMEDTPTSFDGTVIEDTQEMKIEQNNTHDKDKDLCDKVPSEMTNNIPECETTRRISVFDMDYENGQMMVTEVDVSVRDVSPVDDTSHASDCTHEETGDATNVTSEDELKHRKHDGDGKLHMDDNDETINVAPDNERKHRKHSSKLSKHDDDIELVNMTDDIFEIKSVNFYEGHALPMENSKTQTCGIGMTDDLTLNGVPYITYPESRHHSCISRNISNSGLGAETSSSATSVPSSVARSLSCTSTYISNCGLGAETASPDTSVPSCVTRSHSCASANVSNCTLITDTSLSASSMSSTIAISQSCASANTSNCTPTAVTALSATSMSSFLTRGDTPNTSVSSSRRSEEVYKYFGCFTPYGARCRPCVYGFRGPLHVWDGDKRKYNLIYNDRVSLDVTHRREIVRRVDNPHQAYSPVSNNPHRAYSPVSYCEQIVK